MIYYRLMEADECKASKICHYLTPANNLTATFVSPYGLVKIR